MQMKHVVLILSNQTMKVADIQKPSLQFNLNHNTLVLQISMLHAGHFAKHHGIYTISMVWHSFNLMFNFHAPE